jgi:hypothetical protein
VFRSGKTRDLKGEPMHALHQTKIEAIDLKTFNANLTESAALQSHDKIVILID